MEENAKGKKNAIEWDEDCEKAFNQINTPILAYADYRKPFRVHMDASELGLGAVLYQRQEDQTLRVISVASRSLSNSENIIIPLSWSSWPLSGLFMNNSMNTYMVVHSRFIQIITH